MPKQLPFERIVSLKVDGQDVQVERKALAVSDVKIVDEEKGIIEAYVSVFGNVDSYNEIVEKGAFGESLKTRRPVGVWMHQWDKPIAKTLEAREDERGLYIKAQLILGVQQAREAYELLKADVINEFSIGYNVLEDAMDAGGVRRLKRLMLYEWSPVLAGANPDTELLRVKGAEPQEQKGEIADQINRLKDEQERKWSMSREVYEVIGAWYDVYFSATTPADDFAALVTEMIGLLQKIVDGTYADVKDGEGTKLTAAAREQAQKSLGLVIDRKAMMIKALTAPAAVPDVKEGRVLSAKNREMIQAAIEGIKAYRDEEAEALSALTEVEKELEALLDATEPPKAAAEGQTAVDPRISRTAKLVQRDARQGAKSLQKVLLRVKTITKG